MNTVHWAVLKSFLGTCSQGEGESLRTLLSEENQALLKNHPPLFGNPAVNGVESLQERLNRIHFSWITLYLRNLTEKDIRLFLAALNDTQSESIKKQLRLQSAESPSLTSHATHFLRSFLWNKLTAEQQELLPISCLPESPLNALVNLSQTRLDQLIIFLGLHDLALELKNIIDNTTLRKIYSTLLPEEEKYLKILSQSREPVIFSRMGLHKWAGEKEALKTLIKQRGMNRLAKALYGQTPSLLWHVKHLINLEEGVLLSKLSTPLENPTALKALTLQILELLSFMRHES